jgi:predicted glycogen debranching enzyme
MDHLEGSLDERLGREWLLTNRRGGYASGTVVGCPTRRYHALLVAPNAPPLGRHVLLANVLESLACGAGTFELSAFEFPGTFHPHGYRYQRGFEYDLAAEHATVRFDHEAAGARIEKRIALCRTADVVRLSYLVEAPSAEPITLSVAPLLAMRDFHHLRHQAAEEPWLVQQTDGGLWVQLLADPNVTLLVYAEPRDAETQVSFELRPVWWHNFRYRVELERGMPGGEDLQNAGAFKAGGRGGAAFDVIAVAYARSPAEARRTARKGFASAKTAARTPGVRTGTTDNDWTALMQAADQFIVRRSAGPSAQGATVLAGYPWFGDWGRDTFISLEGLLLVPRRFTEAREVLRTFASVQRNGLIPNLFTDRGDACEYNSVDASLWYVHAADRYLACSKDPSAWGEFLGDACFEVVDWFRRGTDFDIRTDERGLLRCGNPRTQITWMDARVWGTPVTPRHGFPVEVNALWYHVLKLLVERAPRDPRARELPALIAAIEEHFEPAFWNAEAACLYDCLHDDGADGAVRPNQIFAVSLPHSPLRPETQRAVVEAVREHLLTPYGLRSLSPADSRYRPRYEGDPAARDGAYHQGTVWSWLIGPYVDAFLKVGGVGAVGAPAEGDSAARGKTRKPGAKDVRSEARALLQPLLDHLHRDACLGSISEIFDADPPHTPRGACAQAWSVAELARVYHPLRPTTRSRS